MSLTQSAIDRSRPPRPGRERPFHFPCFRRQRLGEGLELFVARMPRVPLVRLDLYTPAGGHFDPPGRAGLATLAAGMLDEGTSRRSAPEIAAAAERLGGRISSGAGWNSTYVSASMLAKDLETGTGLLAEIALAPSFPEAELERLRRDRLAELLQLRDDPRSRAQDRFARVVYGEGVYGCQLQGEEDSVQAISRQEVLGFYDRYFARGGSCLVAVGDLDPEAVAELARRLLGAAFDARQPPLPDFRTAPLEAQEIHVVDRPGASQTELLLGHAGIERKHPDYVPLLVMNDVLGGKFTSRINLNLRERHGYTYGAHSQIVGRLGPGPYQISAAVGTEVAGAALRETLHEVRRIQQELVEPEELEDTKSYIRGVFAQQLQTIDDLAFRLGTLGIYGLPDDHFDRYLEEIEVTDRETVLAMARRHLHPERMVVVAVGPAAQLVPQLEEQGPVTVWDARGEGTGG